MKYPTRTKSTRGLRPEAVRHVYLLAILPIMTYAAHAVHLTRTDIKTMESTHGNIIKSSLGLSKYSMTSPLIASLDIQRVESVINNQTINLLRRCLMGDSLASQFYWTLYKQGELDDKTLIGRASHLIQKNELTFTKTIFNDIFHVNTKSVLFEHVPHGSNGLIDSLRVIFNDYDTDNMNYARMLLRQTHRQYASLLFIDRHRRKRIA